MPSVSSGCCLSPVCAKCVKFGSVVSSMSSLFYVSQVCVKFGSVVSSLCQVRVMCVSSVSSKRKLGFKCVSNVCQMCWPVCVKCAEGVSSYKCVNGVSCVCQVCQDGDNCCRCLSNVTSFCQVCQVFVKFVKCVKFLSSCDKCV